MFIKAKRLISQIRIIITVGAVRIHEKFPVIVLDISRDTSYHSKHP